MSHASASVALLGLVLGHNAGVGLRLAIGWTRASLFGYRGLTSCPSTFQEGTRSISAIIFLDIVLFSITKPVSSHAAYHLLTGII